MYSVHKTGSVSGLHPQRLRGQEWPEGHRPGRAELSGQVSLQYMCTVYSTCKTGFVVRSAPLPLSDQLMVTLFPAAIQVSLTTDDNTVLQAGGECLRSYIAVAPEQVASFTDNQVKGALKTDLI